MSTYIALGYILELVFGGSAVHPDLFKHFRYFADLINKKISERRFSANISELIYLCFVILESLVVFLLINTLLDISAEEVIWIHAILYTVLIFLILDIRGIGKKSIRVSTALRENDIAMAAKEIGLNIIYEEKNNKHDQRLIISETVGMIARKCVSGFAGPMFFVFIGGPALGFTYKVIEAAAKSGGWAAKLHNFAEFIPNRIAGLFVFLSGGVGGKKTALGMKKHSQNKYRRNELDQGYMESAMLAILDLEILKNTETMSNQPEDCTTNQPAHNFEISSIADASRIMYTSVFLCLIAFYLIAMKFGFR